jgi:LSD1 subclass zinc finger protein
MPVRFVDAVERPCEECGKPVAVAPGQDAVRCAACGAWQAADPRRRLLAFAKCPRCGRDVEVPVDKESAVCPRCGTAMALGPAARDTL